MTNEADLSSRATTCVQIHLACFLPFLLTAFLFRWAGRRHSFLCFAPLLADNTYGKRFFVLLCCCWSRVESPLLSSRGRACTLQRAGLL